MVFIIVMVCYADRTNIGIVLAQADFSDIPAGDKGIVLSSFFIGYMITQIPGGYLARRYGAKPIFLLAAVTWTVFDMLTPLAAQFGLVPLILVRIGMGLGEGMTFPTQHALTGFWVPTHERAFLVNFMTSGQDIGSVLANVASPRLLELGTWVVFVCWGGLAISWCLMFMALGASAPETHGPCSRSGEASWIRQHRKAASFEDARRVHEAMLPRRLLRERCVWAIVAGHVGVNYAWYVMISWMPTYFEGMFGLKLADNPVTLAAPYFASWAGGVASGKVADMLVGHGFRTRHVRKTMQAVGAVGSTFFFQLAARSRAHTWAAVWVSSALFCGKCANAGYWVNMVDICPESAAAIMGLSNTIATIPGIVGQPITQAILDAGGGAESVDAWSIVFGVGGAVALCAALIFAAFADDENLDQPTQRNAGDGMAAQLIRGA
eukprot:CAMPEP_0117472030 /NCGR_PEP_ID=MMETSP0784-20121206/8035_1 /TAXON_ID=39447 /ORGANISM="" /LENGTH=435 /DNA_ID=CAMNT_0005266165 /DNA_START=120 /DNA_END=1427 /DNA_ORIENTATION=+